MCDSCHSGGTMDPESDEPNGARFRSLTGMNAHPYPDLLTFGPNMFGQGELHLDDRCHTCAGRGEHCEETVTLGTDLFSSVSAKAGTDDPVVIGESLGVRLVSEPLEQRRRALDIGEQKGERFRGQSLSDRSNGMVVRACGGSGNDRRACSDGVGLRQRGGDGTVRHLYSKGAQMADDRRERGIDLMTPVWHLLDLTPNGRDDWYPSLSY